MPRLKYFGSLKHFVRRLTLAPDQVTSRDQWLEICLFPLLAVAAAWLFSPADPVLSDAMFPWLWFAPVLVALRYGVLPGLLASVPILASQVVAVQLGLAVHVFPPALFFGGGLLVLICGEFADVWRDRNQRMDETNLYLTERLSRLTKRHLLLNLSP